MKDLELPTELLNNCF